jgi:hypothetical protein
MMCADYFVGTFQCFQGNDNNEQLANIFYMPSILYILNLILPLQ